MTVDSLDPELMAAFWAALLGTSVRGRWEQYVGLHPVAGQPALVFQRVAAKAAGKSALHLDLHVDDEEQLEQVVQQALELGARLVDRVVQLGERWVVMADPEGNPFCVVRDAS